MVVNDGLIFYIFGYNGIILLMVNDNEGEELCFKLIYNYFIIDNLFLN